MRNLAVVSGLFLSLCLSFNSWAAPSSPTINEEMGSKKGAEIWERFYKFSVMIKNGRLDRLVYQNLEEFELHRNFLKTQSEFAGLTLDQIDKLSYAQSNERRAYTGVLIIHAGDDAIHRSRFNMAMEEAPTAKLVAEIHALIVRSDADGNLGDALDFAPLPHQVDRFLGQVAELKTKDIKTVFDSNESESISYTDGWSVGQLVAVQNQAELETKFRAGQITKDTIVYAREALRDIPRIGGVISAVKMTPASHTVLLAQMYGIPVVYFQNAKAHFEPLVGQRIFVRADGNPEVSLSMRRAEYRAGITDQDVQLLKQLRAKPTLQVGFDTAPTKIANAKDLTRKDISAYGGKASQIGALMRNIPQNTVNAALAVPLSLSVKFFNTAKARDGQTLRKFIDGRLASLGTGQVEEAALQRVSNEIKEEIKAAKLPEAEVAALQTLIDRTFTGATEKLRIRSSSNVEDGKEFNGAGLYDSEGYRLRGPDPEKLDKEMKKVIASLYNARAITARRLFGVNEQKVGMGLLIHRAFQEEIGNGVVRLVRKDDRDQVEIISMEEEEVTHAENKAAAEVVSVMGGQWFKIVQPYKTFSNNRSLFPQAVYFKIAELIAKVAPEYLERGSTAVDIESEFKIMKSASGEPLVFLKQVRPVPHPSGGQLTDGSKFILIGGKTELQMDPSNQPLAYFDLWMPRNIVLDLETATAEQIRRGQIKVKSVSFSMRGQAFNIANPAVKGGPSEHSAYNFQIDLANTILPGMYLELSTSKKDPASHSLNSPEAYIQLFAPKQAMAILRAMPNGAERASHTFEIKPVVPAKVETRTGPFTLSSPEARIEVTSAQTLFTGDGDNRQTRMGEAVVTGIGNRALKLPANAIGYGANHHSGFETFVFDLFADSSLSSAEREAIDRSHGRFLYADRSLEEFEGARKLIGLKQNGQIKKLGQWKTSEDHDQ